VVTVFVKNAIANVPTAPPDEVVVQFSKKVRPSKSTGSTNSDHVYPAGEPLLTRKQLAKRWRYPTETVKRRERAGILQSLHFNGRNVRYRLEDVEKLEREAESLIRGS
jgi:hypothetical protein